MEPPFSKSPSGSLGSQSPWLQLLKSASGDPVQFGHFLREVGEWSGLRGLIWLPWKAAPVFSEGMRAKDLQVWRRNSMGPGTLVWTAPGSNASLAAGEQEGFVHTGHGTEPAGVVRFIARSSEPRVDPPQINPPTASMSATIHLSHLADQSLADLTVSGASELGSPEVGPRSLSSSRPDNAHPFLEAKESTQAQRSIRTPNELAEAVSCAARILEERRQGSANLPALHLGQRAAALVHDLRNRLTLISLQQQRFAMEQAQGAQIPVRQSVGGTFVLDGQQPTISPSVVINQEGQTLLEEARAMCAAFVPEENALAVPEVLDVRPMLLRCAQTAPGMVRSGTRKVSIRVRCRADVQAFADPVLLARLLENLLVNALEASQSGKIVSVSALQRERRIWLTVADEGLGMDQAGLQRAYAPGQTEAGGTGYGSVSLISALQGLKGEFFVDSAPGSGTRCRVVLPAPPEAGGVWLVDSDDVRRRRQIARLAKSGVVAIGMPRCSAAIRAIADGRSETLYLARGLVDGRLGDLLLLAKSRGCSIQVLDCKGNAQALAVGVKSS